ncbi:MAG TPA: nucleotidyl transferase AbiEii/AbiGii toxin family protein [Candidatus Limnocylindrales bacterium]|nr:nucleotidyl transferase AbiEii/AbiGii toxin family protein [Candidatus Limnocylindrales bacterium]
MSQLVLKGGVLLAAYGTRRTTRDIDFQGRWITNEMKAVLGLVKEIASVVLDDGLVFEHGVGGGEHDPR